MLSFWHLPFVSCSAGCDREVVVSPEQSSDLVGTVRQGQRKALNVCLSLPIKAARSRT